MKHERKAQEKYWNFIQMIDEKRKTAGINKIKVSYFDFVQNPSIKSVETGTVLLERLERDKGIKILERPKLDHLNSAGENDFTIEVLPEFDGIFNREYKNYVAMADDFQADHSTIESFESRPIIKAKSLELIAKKIGDMDSGSNLVEILTNCGVKQELIEYPNTKWRMVYSVLFALATSSKLQDQEVLFKIIEEAAHPLMHNGDEKIAKLYEDELNNLLKYDNFALKKGKLKKIDQQSEQDDEYENDDDDAFSYDGGISSSYENTDLELFILKKILLEHKRRDDCGFFAKEFSFNNNSLEEICRTINKLIEDKILYLSANSRPERFENKEGIEDKRGFINWKMVERMDKNPQATSEQLLEKRGAELIDFGCENSKWWPSKVEDQSSDFYIAKRLAMAYAGDKINEGLKELEPLLSTRGLAPVSFISGNFDENFLNWFFVGTYAMWNVSDTAINELNNSFTIIDSNQGDYSAFIVASPYVEGWAVIGGKDEFNGILILGKNPKILFKNQKESTSFSIDINSENGLQYVWPIEFYDIDKDGVPEIWIRYNNAWADGFSQELSVYKIQNNQLKFLKQFSGTAEGLARRLSNGRVEVANGFGESGHLGFDKYKLQTWEYKNGDFVKISEKTIPHVLLGKDWIEYYK